MNCAYTCATDAYDGNKNLMAEQNASRTPAPEGGAWRTVPVEPTEAMLVNGREALMPLVRLDSYGPLIGVWEDMLAASPVVPVGSANTLERQAAEIKRLREVLTMTKGPLGSTGPTPVYEAVLAALTGEDK
jgi:hypothetical protein